MVNCVVKAQIHAGGRGKGGGVKPAAAPPRQWSTRVFGYAVGPPNRSGREGSTQGSIEEGTDIAREFMSLWFLTVKRNSLPDGIDEGGMDIEKVAEETPEKILKEWIEPAVGLSGYQCRKIAYALGLEGAAVRAAGKVFVGLYKAFIAKDASLAEINPLVVTGDNEIIALDAKFNFDSNAMYRQKAIVEMRDLSEEDEREIEASKYDLAYIALDGNIGCLVNGAGLAMATMDTIKLFGGEPANFLDVGGGATTEKVTAAFKLILADSAVRCVMVNIFGGIMKCDVIAEGVVAAAKEVGLNVPLVVRLAGTNVELGKQILADSGLPIISAGNMGDAARKAVEAAS